MCAIRLRYVPGCRLLADELAGRVGREPDLDLAPAGAGRDGGGERGSVEVLVVEEPAPGASIADGMDGIRAARAIGARVVVLAAGDDPTGAVEAARAGADAWLPRGCSADELLHVVRHVADGHAFYPPETQVAILRALRADVTDATRRTAQQAEDGPLAALTAREREVLEDLADGHDARGIAIRLGLSYNTVRTHMNEIFRKLDVHSRIEAIRLALAARVPPDDAPRVTTLGRLP